jgi:TonB family protein
MSQAWKKLEGLIVDGQFPLQQYLGGSEHAAVFLTQSSSPQPQKAAIKLVVADPVNAERQLSRWRGVAKLSHPNLLRVFRAGRCRLNKSDVLFLAMEFADENLAEILPQRALTAEETRAMLEPVLDALAYLHAEGFVHAHIKPSNILAAGDQLKLSSDVHFRIGESGASLGKLGPYDPPEFARGTVSPAGDVWSLGMTLVETLTQHLPAWQPSASLSSDPIVAQNLPEPFLEIAQRSLRRDAHQRWSVADIAACLNPSLRASAAAANAATAAAPASVTATAAAAPAPPAPAQTVSKPVTPPVSPLAVPLSPVSPRPAPQNLPVPPRPVAKTQKTSVPGRPFTLPHYAIPITAAAIILILVLAVPRLLDHRSVSQPVASTTADRPPVSPSTSAPVPAQPSPSPAHSQPASERKSASPYRAAVPSPSTSQPPATSSLKTTADKEPLPKETSQPPQPSAAAASSVASPSTAPSNSEILDQVLPDVPQKALDTIQGKIRVSIHVHVDPSGSVSQADLDSPGPSKYFADQALQAARRWVFQSPEVDGHSAPSEWLIHFEFTPAGAKATPKRVAP